MRISTNQVFDRSLTSILESQQKLSKANEQISTGKRINSPADDPVGAASILRLKEELVQLENYDRNNTLLTNALEQEESVLEGIKTAVSRARVLTVQAGNSAIDTSTIGLEMQQITQQVFDLMNSQNADGDYIFAGSKSNSPAYVYDETAVGNKYIYQGDGQANKIQISPSVLVASSDTGATVFEGVRGPSGATVTGGSAASPSISVGQQGAFDTFHIANYDALTATNNEYTFTVDGSGNNVVVTNALMASSVTIPYVSGSPVNFNGLEVTMSGGSGTSTVVSLDPPTQKNLADTLNDFTTALLDTTLSDSQKQAALEEASYLLKGGYETVLNTQTSLGGRINVSESIRQSNADLELSAETIRSRIEDVDLAEAITELSKQETALQAAQATFARVTSLSLFDVI